MNVIIGFQQALQAGPQFEDWLFYYVDLLGRIPANYNEQFYPNLLSVRALTSRFFHRPMRAHAQTQFGQDLVSLLSRTHAPELQRRTVECLSVLGKSTDIPSSRPDISAFSAD